jgi:protein SCO1
VTSEEEDLDIEDDEDEPRPQLRVIRGERRASGGFHSVLLVAIVAGLSAGLLGCRSRTAATQPSMPDAQLVDNRGAPVDLASMKGKVVLLDFIHVGCPGVCSNLVNKFGQVADILGPELGSKVILVSVSNDPAHDTPAELLKLAQSSQADMKGWFFLTGDPAQVDRLVKAFGVNNKPLPDGSPNHITEVFLLGPDGREIRQYQGMVMNSRSVATEIQSTLERDRSS